MRRVLVAAVVVFAASCAHKPPPPSPPPPAPPKGDLLRFKAKKGDGLHSKVKLLIEQEGGAPPGDKRPPRNVLLQFTFGEEEEVDSAAADGSTLVDRKSTRLNSSH